MALVTWKLLERPPPSGDAIIYPSAKVQPLHSLKLSFLLTWLANIAVYTRLSYLTASSGSLRKLDDGEGDDRQGDNRDDFK